MTSTDETERVRALARDLPKLHFWNGSWQVGGLTVQIADRLADLVLDLGQPRVVETGAGASTLIFLAAGASQVTSIAPDVGLGERIRAAGRERGLPMENWTYVAERSEEALPVMARTGSFADLAFIDGNHGMPSVFVDFCYLNTMIRSGGILVVDDLHLHSCSQLALLLRRQPEFELLTLDVKQGVFRKLSDERYLPDWRGQPFLTDASLIT
jgi:hypothetical protein